MKRVDLIWHLEAHGGSLLREGGSHSIFVGVDRRLSSVPRHRELNDHPHERSAAISAFPSLPSVITL
jgi:mRNA interferase HicA